MRALTVLCDRVGDLGGAERYWETVLPAIAAREVRVRLLGREVADGGAFGVEARAIRWGDEEGTPCADAAREVATELRERPPDAVITASVFDTEVLDAVRDAAPRWLVKIHDHRSFCPTGDRVFPQFPAPCSARMGTACRANTLVRGCVHGPRTDSFRKIAAREHLRERIARADRVLVSSRHMRATCTTNGVDDDRLAITPPPLPDAAFPASFAPRPRARTLLFASRLTPRKGLRSLIAALARIDAERRPLLVVAGEGEREESDARADAARLGVRADWRGKLSAEQLRAAIDEAWAVAVPSLWPEPFGLVGIEAQARGRPAVAYASGGIGDWIEGAGIAVPRGDERALADAIRRVFDERTWEELAARAGVRAQEYRLDAHVERLMTICDAA